MPRPTQRTSRTCRFAFRAALATSVAAFGPLPPLAAGANVWTAVGPNGGSAFAVVVDPVDSTIVYAGVYGGVFKSTSSGATWQAAGRGLKAHPVLALAIDPGNHLLLYAAAGTTPSSGVWASRDGAATWETVLLLDNNFKDNESKEIVRSLAVDPAHPETVYAASNFHIYVSRDAGSTWTVALDYTTVSPHLFLTAQLAADPDRSSVFALLADNFSNPPYFKLLESADGGASWLDRSTALPDGRTNEITALAIEPTSPGTLYLAGNTVFRSRDGAASWQQLGVSLPYSYPPLAAGPHGLVVAGDLSSSTVLRSLDGGTTWERSIHMPIDTGSSINGLALGASPDQIYAVVEEALGVVATGDGGASWQAADRGLRAMSAFAVAINPQNPSEIFTLGDGDSWLQSWGVYRSRTAGGNWLPLDGPRVFYPGLWWATTSYTNLINPNTLFVDPAQPSHVIYGSGRYGHSSTDAGTTWTPLANPDDADCNEFNYLSPEPSAPSILYTTAAGGVCKGGCGAWKSVDGGATWSCVGISLVQRIVVAPSDPNVLYAVKWIFGLPPGDHLLWKSTDAGATWAPIDAQLPFTSLPLIDEPYLTVDPHNAQRIFVGTSYGVWRSNNGGRRWFELDRGLPHGKPDQYPFSPLLAVDPNDSRLVYAAAPDFGVYRSHDGGSHWQPILGGLPPLNPGINYVNYYLTLVPDPQKSGTVYLGTFDNGVLVYSAQ
jgi:photosystem II stability/assembly factor-like uncharacterized protein